MHIVLTGGGTAGHVNPAIAIAEIFRQKDPETKITFVGTPNGMENRLVAKAGYPMRHVKVKGFSRSLSPKNLYAAYLAWHSPHAARKLLKELKPDLVVGTGGYVSWPILKAAALEGIPSAIHESNAVPGLTVKKLEKHVDKILLNFPESAEHFSAREKTVAVGNPLRHGFVSADREKVRASLGIGEENVLVLSFGGSLGATVLNRACIKLMADYVSKNPTVYHIHASGERNYESCKQELDALIGDDDVRERITLTPYIDNMPELMQAADVIISRAGAMTISEIALASRASILIPSPNVTNAHQLKNAQVLANANAAILIEEGEKLNERLSEQVSALVENAHFRKTVAHHAKSYAHPEANDVIYNELTALLR